MLEDQPSQPEAPGQGPASGNQNQGAAKASFRSLLPSLDDYSPLRLTWRADVLSGLTVGIVALPLALAFGVSSGAGAEAGLITAIVAGLVAAIFGGSNVQVSGPTGAMVVVLAPIMAAHGTAVLGFICMVAGVLVIVAGLLRLGRMVAAVPWPVIEGFTHGVAVIIFLQQFPAFLGVENKNLSSSPVVATLQCLGRTDWSSVIWTVLAAGGVAATMVLGARISRQIPWSLVGLVLVTTVYQLAGIKVAIIGHIPPGLPAPTMPAVDFATIKAVLGGTLAVAALAAIESLLSARVAAQHRQTGPFNADRELIGQGLASITAGFFGGMPASGAVARTAVNVSSGARTRVAAVVHALTLVAIVYTASTVVDKVPLAALAGVLMVTAVRMVPLSTAKTLMHLSHQDALLFTMTAVITVSVDLIYAVAIGIAVAAVFALRTISSIAGVYRVDLPGPPVEGDELVAYYSVDGALFFATAERLLDQVSHIEGVQVVVVGMDRVRILDSTGAQVLSDMVATLEERHITVLLHSFRPSHLEMAKGAGVFDALEHPEHNLEDEEQAIALARWQVAQGRAAGGPPMPDAGPPVSQ